MRTRIRAALPAPIGFVVFTAVLRTELRAVTWHAPMIDRASMSGWQLAVAVGLTFGNSRRTRCWPWSS